MRKYPDKQPLGYKPLIGLLVIILLSGAALTHFLCNWISVQKAQELEQYDPDNIIDERLEKIASLKKLLEIDPKDLNTLHELGRFYNELQEYKKALLYLEKADRLAQEQDLDKQKTYEILSDLAHSLSKMKRFGDAIRVLERAKKTAPKQTRAYNYKGNIHDLRKEYDKARREYLAAKRIDKKDPQSYKNLANQALRKNKKRSALELLKQAIRNNPYSFLAFENLGDGYNEIKEYTKAISSYNRGLELKPPAKDAARIHYKIAKIHQKLGDLSEYEKSLLSGNSTGFVHPRISEELGDLQLKKGNLQDALSYYKKALSKDSGNKELRDKYQAVYSNYLKQLGAKDDTRTDSALLSDPSQKTIVSDSVLEDSFDLDDGLGKRTIPGGDQTPDISDLVAEGKVAFNNKQYALAERSFREGQSTNPRHPEIDYLLARAQDKLKKDIPAIANYEKATKKNPKDKRSYYYLGLIYYKQKKYPTALLMFQKAVRIDPKFVNAHYSQGLCYDKLKRNFRAVQSYKTALGIDPDLFQGYFNLGISYKKLKKYDRALKSFDKASDINPNDANLYYQRGEIYSLQKKPEEALIEYETSLKEDPKHYEARFNSALLYSQLGEKSKAETILTALRNEYPQDVPVIYQLGKIADETNQISQAIAYYQEAIETDPDYHKAYLNLGEIYSRQGEDRQAKDLYRAVLKLRPTSFEALYNLGNLHFKKKEYSSAKVYYEKALAINSANIETRLTYAETLEGLNSWEAAKKEYVNILQSRPKHLIAMERLAFLYYRKLNDQAEARNIFEKIVNNYPQHPKRTEYEKLIQVLNQ